MTLQDLGSIGEFVAAIATLITLIYLAVQIRQNTGSVRSATAQSASDAIVGMNSLIAGDRNLAELMLAAVQEPKKLDLVDQLRFSALISNTFITFGTMFLQNRLGLIQSEFWQSRERYLLNTLLPLPGIRWWWRQNREPFGAEFRQYIDAHVGQPEGKARRVAGYRS